MKKEFSFIVSLLFVFGLVNGQKKNYYNSYGEITQNKDSAVEYTIIGDSAMNKDTLSVKTTFYMSGQKKAVNSILKTYKKGKFIDQKWVGESCQWFENGNIQMKSFYENGKLQGELCTYWPNGTQRRKDKFDKDVLIEGNCYDSLGNKIEKYFPYQTLPAFPGGDKMLFRFLGENVKYPVIPMLNNIQGRVLVKFFVDVDGKITDLKILKKVNLYLDIEALRVIMAMPDWIPGTLEGKKVRYSYILPINFSLE